MEGCTLKVYELTYNIDNIGFIILRKEAEEVLKIE